jgi:hypothetical protein
MSLSRARNLKSLLSVGSADIVQYSIVQYICTHLRSQTSCSAVSLFLTRFQGLAAAAPAEEEAKEAVAA